MISAIVRVRPVERLRAVTLGRYWRRCAASRTRAPIPGSTDGCWLSTRETVARETPAASAT